VPRIDGVTIIPVPFGAGSAIAGAEDAPSSILADGFPQALEKFGAEVSPFLAETRAKISEGGVPAEEGIRNLVEVEKVAQRVRDQVMEAFRRNRMPLVVGGDHSVGIGSIAGHADFYGIDVSMNSVIWLDAHADMNTPLTSPSGSIHGMPLATVLGYGHPRLLAVQRSSRRIAPPRVLLIGVRDVDAGEDRLLRISGVNVISGSPYDHEAARAGLDSFLKESAPGPIHLSVDMDVFPAEEITGISYPVKGGASVSEVLEHIGRILGTNRVVSADVVELNPGRDSSGASVRLARRIITELVSNVWER
jgi:arginase